MGKKIKFLTSSALVALTFLIPQEVHSMQDQEQKYPSNRQLIMLEADTLGSILGLGNNTLLKMSMDLKDLKMKLGGMEFWKKTYNRCVDFSKKQIKIPIQLFLTDFNLKCSADYPVINLNIKVNCEPTEPTCVLPNKPQSFESYNQFTDWLAKGHLTNKIRLTYDFSVDVLQSTPDLVQYLSEFCSEGYHFIGTHEIVNDVITPNRCEPELSYTSVREKTNTTTVKLGGKLYLDYYSYPIEDHEQVFSHSIIKQIAFERKYYSLKYLEHFEVKDVCYSEFPVHQIQNWPKAPFGTYHLLRQELVSSEEIHHITCWDGKNGAEVDMADILTDGKFFPIIHESVQVEGSSWIESIVWGDSESSYIARYQYETDFQEKWASFEKKASNINILADLYERLCVAEPRYWTIQKTLDSLEVFSSIQINEGFFCGEREETVSLIDAYRDSAKSLMSRLSDAGNTGTLKSNQKDFFFKQRAPLRQKIKEYILEGMELYQQVFGQKHPRLGKLGKECWYWR